MLLIVGLRILAWDDGFIKKPILIFNKKKRNLNFHFDLMHGENNLDKAINLLDEVNKKDFRKINIHSVWLIYITKSLFLFFSVKLPPL